MYHIHDIYEKPNHPRAGSADRTDQIGTPKGRTDATGLIEQTIPLTPAAGRSFLPAQLHSPNERPHPLRAPAACFRGAPTDCGIQEV